MEALPDDFARLKADYAQKPYPSYRERRDWLTALEQTIRLRQHDLYKAAALDFGQRSDAETRLLEVLPTLQHLLYCRKQLKDWLRPQQRHVAWLFQPARNFVCFQPKGVIGVIVPWNYPIFLAFGPIAAALAAGNKVMVKMSEFTPATNQVIREILTAALPHQVHLVEGDASVAAAFSQLPFDHLLYTGSTAVGYQVMRAASANLTPITLELGGKSPLIWADAPVSAGLLDRLIFGKTANAGQTCVAPDYVLLVKKDLPAFVEALKQRVALFYPTGTASPEWTAIINQRHQSRLQQLLDGAVASGAQVIPLMTALPLSCTQNSAVTQRPSEAAVSSEAAVPSDAPADTSPLIHSAQEPPYSDARSAPFLMPFSLVVDAPLDNSIWHEEIFGPVLPIAVVDSFEQALQFVAERPRPLALYLFSYNTQQQNQVLSNSHSGGVCLNDCVVHVGQDDLPFGGIGPSGMGHYHGKEGFLTFSHHKAVHVKGRWSSGFVGYPQYRPRFLDKLLDWWLR